MANPKSKTPTSSRQKRAFNHSDLTFHLKTNVLRRSQSQLENHGERLKQETIRRRRPQSENVNRNNVDFPELLETRTPVSESPILQVTPEFRPRKTTFRLTYDPNREPGNEYQVAKISVSDYGEDGFETNKDDDVKSHDNLTVGTDEVSLSVGLDENSTIYNGERAESDNRQVDDDINVDEADVVPNNTHEDIIDSRSHTVIDENESSIYREPVVNEESTLLQNNRLPSHVSSHHSHIIEKDLTLQSIVTHKTNKSKSPKPLTPTDRGETNIIFKDVGSRVSEYSIKEPVISPAQEESTQKESHTRTSTRLTDSIPPPDFKLNLFNRIRRTATPKRLAKLNRYLDKSSRIASKKVVSELTFVKESKVKRFERMSSSDSIRFHYDNRNRIYEGNRKFQLGESFDNIEMNKENIGDSIESVPKVNKMENIRQIVAQRKTAKIRSDTSELDDVTDIISTEESRYTKIQEKVFGQNGVFHDKAVLANRKLNGAKHVAKTSRVGFKGSELGHKSMAKTAQSSFIGSDDIFTEDERREHLKRAQYLNNGLKLVKKKVKHAGSAKQINQTSSNNQTKRKAVLSNTNRNKLASGVVDSFDIDDDILSEKSANVSDIENNTQSLKWHTNPLKRVQTQSVEKSPHKVGVARTNIQQNIAQNKQVRLNNKQKNGQRNRTNQSMVIFNKALRKKRKPSITFKESNDDTKRDKPLVQPRIHKMRAKNIRKASIESTGQNQESLFSQTTANSQVNVVNWLMNSVNEEAVTDVNRTNIDSAKRNNTKGAGNINSKSGKPKLKVRMQKRLIRKTSPNSINSGAYMPLPKMARRRRLFTRVGKFKGYESEIPISYSDEEELFQEPRPLTDTGKNRLPPHMRYEGNDPSNFRDQAYRNINQTNGALVRFFRNGDPHYTGLGLPINKSFRSFEQLLVYLTERIPTPTGVRHIFRWPEGNEIKSLTQFENRTVYIVSSTEKLDVDCKYGWSKEKFWSNKKPSASKVRKDELGLYQRPASPKERPTKHPGPAFVLNILSNSDEERQEKVILNPKTQQSYEEFLRDHHSPSMPVQALYTKRRPHVKIKSFSHLFRELKHDNNFIACAENDLPNELKKRQAPSSNSSTDSINESRSRKKKLPRQQEMGQIHENYENGRPVSTSMSKYDYGPRYFPPGGRGPARVIDSRRKDAIVVEIDGVMREFIPPSYFDPQDDGAKPDRMLSPEWVYGFRGRDARQNLLVIEYQDVKELVYYVAAVVVLYNKDKDLQRHYTKHTEEITCMTLHPDRKLIATGQLQGKVPEHGAHIRIWNGETLSTYFVIGLGVFSGGILSIGFSQDGQKGTYMCALDMSEKHVLSVWDWQHQRIIARTSTTNDPVHYACFYPDGHNTSILITYGVKHIYFWKIFYDRISRKEAKILRDRNSGIFEVKAQEEIPDSVNCICWLPSGEIVTGDSNGNLIVWQRDSTDAFTRKMLMPAHNHPIMALCLLADGTLLSGGGTEIKAWDTVDNFSAVKGRQIPEAVGHIRSIVTHEEGGTDGRLYIGTAQSTVLDGSLQKKFKCIIQGHGQGVWGVVSHPFEPTFISAGQDQVVFKWNLVTHRIIWRTHIEAPSSCVAIDHRLEHVVVGTVKGILIFLNGYNGMHIATIAAGPEPIGCLSFSRDCLLLAIGSNDGSIAVFEMADKKQLIRSSHVSQTSHKTGVAHLDWSTDGRSIQSVDYNHDLIFWNVENLKEIEITRLVRDVDWYTATCDMAYYMIGPWSNLERGEYIKAASRSNARDLILTGDTNGRLRLYKYPCSKEKADFRGVRVYSSDVTAIAMTPDNRSALTCGGLDNALIQWSLVEDSPFYNS